MTQGPRPPRGARWSGLKQSERRTLVARWRKHRAMPASVRDEQLFALVRAVEHAVIDKVMRGKLHILTPED